MFTKKGHGSIFCFETLLVLVEIHTLFVMLTYQFLSPLYVFSGFSFLFLKGLVFFLAFRDNFAVVDIVVSLLLLLLLADAMPVFLFVIIFIYLVIKTFMAFMHVGHHH